MESSQQQQMKKTQDKIEEQRLPSLVKEINKETKEVRKIKGEMINAPDEKKAELELYLNTLKEKVDLILVNVTEEKIKKANLAQLAKAIRTFTGEIVSASGGKVRRSESKILKVNINVEGMTKEQLIEFLNKKSQEKE